jgi:WD40 repeat protein
LISDTNYKISAWKHYNGEFKNSNEIDNKYNIDKSYFTCSFLLAKNPQTCMAWDSTNKNLYTGQIDGKLLKWDLSKHSYIQVINDKDTKDSKKAKKIEIEITINRKTKGMPTKDEVLNFNKNLEFIARRTVSYILVINKLQLIAVSYLDGRMILWDMKGNVKKRYHIKHKKGLYKICFDASKNLLFACGYKHKIYVYDPYIDQKPIYKLYGHVGSINDITINEKDAELISIDINRNVKVWDINNLTCFQTFNLNKKNKEISNKNFKLLFLKKSRKIMIYGNNKVIFYESDNSLNPDIADDQILFACYYDKIAKNMISFCLRKIKMWNPFTGKIKKVYEDPMNNEITAYTIDKNYKRSFLGDNTGKIKCFNMKNGNYLKDLEPHDVEINILIHSLELNIVISCSIDDVIKIHDDTELTDSNVLKTLLPQEKQVKALSILIIPERDKANALHKRLAIGLNDGTIKFYDIEHFRNDSPHNDLKSSYDLEITCLYPVKNHFLIFSGHKNGQCRLMVTPPHSEKFNVICEFTNEYKNENDENEYNLITPITCMDVDYKANRLFIGDSLGRIQSYDISILFTLLDETNGVNSECIIFINIVTQISKGMKFKLLWEKQAHKEKIKSIHHSE